jgi:small subunit ribosomal protein S7
MTTTPPTPTPATPNEPVRPAPRDLSRDSREGGGGRDRDRDRRSMLDEADPADIIQNEDGSITLAVSGVPKGPVAQEWVGVGLKPDSRYGNLMVAKFINCLMWDGKKSIAEKIFYGAMDQIADKLKSDPLPVFEQAIENAKPLVEVRSKRIGGANYQVPVEVNKRRQQTLAIRWILEAVRTRKGRPTGEKLAQELVDCYNKTGTTIQKRENTHRMAEANKAFSHFA